MNKNLLVIITAVIIAGLAIAGYFYWKSGGLNSEDALQKAGDAAQKISDSATKGVLPSIQTNPLADSPDLNPADQTNPFQGVKTNPFE